MKMLKLVSFSFNALWHHVAKRLHVVHWSFGRKFNRYIVKDGADLRPETNVKNRKEQNENYPNLQSYILLWLDHTICFIMMAQYI